MNLALAFGAVLSQRIVIQPPPEPPAPERDIVVEAGKFDRQGAIVHVDLTKRDGSRRLVLRDASGRVVPFQVDAQGKATFFVDKLPAGARAKYHLSEEKKAPAPKARVTVDEKKPDVIRVLVDGKLALQLQRRPIPVPKDMSPAIIRAGYIHPVLSPAGAPLTDAYPQDQPRHTGIWSFWKELEAKNQKLDFWTKPGEEGRTQMESAGQTWEGPVSGGFEMRQILTGLKAFAGQTLLRESWHVSVYAPTGPHPQYYLFDIDSEQKPPLKGTVKLPRAKGGGIAVRGRLEWSKAAVNLTSEADPLAPRARWAYLGGKEKGKVAGIAVLSPPSNIGAPQGIYRGDVPQTPLINFSPVAEDAVTVSDTQPLPEHYRFVALDGKPDPKLLERLWNDLASPPTTSVEFSATKQTAPKPPATK